MTEEVTLNIQIVTGPAYRKAVEHSIRTKPHLVLEPNDHENYVHFLVKGITTGAKSDPHLEKKNACNNLRTAILRTCKTSGLAKPTFGNVKDINLSIPRQDTVEEWLSDMKYEHSAELRGTLKSEYIEFFNSITPKVTEETKEELLPKKAVNDMKQEKMKRRAYLTDMLRLAQKYSIQQLSDVINDMNTEDRIEYMTTPSNEKVMQNAIDLISNNRCEFEINCRGKNWRWWEIALVNLFKCGLSKEQKELVRSGNIEYLQAGMELLEKIFKKNKIDPTCFHNDVTNVLECKTNKMNSLYLSGSSDAGKTTLSKIICEPFSRAMIGQSGNASVFIFQDVPNKFLCQIEEAVFMPGLVNDFKNLCGGETNWSINVKNKKNQKVTRRTPVILTSNALPWALKCADHEETFRNRGYVWEFKTALTKKEVKDICKKYQKVQKSEGELHLSLLHYIAVIESKKGEKEKSLEELMGGFRALAEHNWIEEEATWCRLNHDAFQAIFNTKYMRAHFSKDEDDEPQQKKQRAADASMPNILEEDLAISDDE